MMGNLQCPFVIAMLFPTELYIEFIHIQECIPVGCVPPTVVAVEGASPPGASRPGTPLGPDYPGAAPPL